MALAGCHANQPTRTESPKNRTCCCRWPGRPRENCSLRSSSCDATDYGPERFRRRSGGRRPFDGARPDEQGDFTLAVDFRPDVCGDGFQTGREHCDDGNREPGDGCDAICHAEPAAVCAAAPPLVFDIDHTSDGVPVFTGSCGGAGSELLYTITPGQPGERGRLQILLANDSPMAVYVRRACTDPGSELACAVVQSSTLELPVEGGVPLTVFVDALTPTPVGEASASDSFLIQALYTADAP